MCEGRRLGSSIGRFEALGVAGVRARCAEPEVKEEEGIYLTDAYGLMGCCAAEGEKQTRGLGKL